MVIIFAPLRWPEHRWGLVVGTSHLWWQCQHGCVCSHATETFILWSHCSSESSTLTWIEGGSDTWMWYLQALMFIPIPAFLHSSSILEAQEFRHVRGQPQLQPSTTPRRQEEAFSAMSLVSIKYQHLFLDLPETCDRTYCPTLEIS